MSDFKSETYEKGRDLIKATYKLNGFSSTVIVSVARLVYNSAGRSPDSRFPLHNLNFPN